MSNTRHKAFVRTALLVGLVLMGRAVIFAQSYTSWRVGNPQDTLTVPSGKESVFAENRPAQKKTR